jgi:hypothetical protein
MATYNTKALENDLLAAYNAQIDSTTAQPAPIEALSEAQATAIAALIKAAIDNTNVAFTLAAPNGAVTGVISLHNTVT